METLELDVEGMSCSGCENAVTNAVERVEGIERADADADTGRVEVTGETGFEEEVRQAVVDAGYDVTE